MWGPAREGSAPLFFFPHNHSTGERNIMKTRSASNSTSRRGRGTTTFSVRSRSRGLQPAKKKGSGGAAQSRSRSGGRSTATRNRTSARSGKSSQTTTDHEEIRRWVESRGGHPATVRRTAKDKQTAGVLRIDFPGFSGTQSLKPISWGEFFEVFDERNLTFLYQDKTSSGKQSRFNKLVCKE
jgi:hypothetical protein